MKNPVKNTWLICLLILLHSCKKDEVEKQIPPTLSEVAVSDIAIFTARLSASITGSGNQPISEHGFVISSTNDKPATDTDSTINKGAIDPATPLPIEISTALTGLKNSTSYYVRVFALLPSGAVYSPTQTFKTADIVQPAITTDTATNITHNSARLAATVRSKGTYNIAEYGIVWATTANPTTAVTTKRATTGNITAFPRAFTADITSLNLNTTYNFRSYVIANGVTTYGANKTFRTLNAVQPGIRTDAASNVNVNSARLSGTVTSAGTFPVSEHGIVWGTAANPTTAQNKAAAGTTVSTYPRSYNVNITGLNKTTTYHFRAFVTSNGVTSYGANQTFTTPDVVQPGIRTDGATNVGVNSARLSGTVTSAGTFPVSEHGIVWGTAANPTTAQNKAAAGSSVAGYPRSYSVDINGLNKTTTYHFRAFVISNGVTSYGANQTFTTPDVVQPGIRTDGATNVGVNSARLSGTVTSAGSYPVSEHGIVWGTAANPTTAQNKAAAGSSVAGYPRSYSVDINGLNKTTTYHFRAFVISNGVTSYGTNQTFTTLDERPPKLSTEQPVNVSAYNATLRGTIHDGGTSGVSEIGVCWGKSPNPTTANSRASKGGGVSYPHDYSFNVSGLEPGSEYHVRAYVVANGVTWYGGDIAFKTHVLSDPGVETGRYSSTATSTTLYGRITGTGSYTLVEHGFVWASNQRIPTLANANKLAQTTPGNLKIPFDYSLGTPALRKANMVYYYRAFVTTSDGKTFYGATMTFTY